MRNNKFRIDIVRVVDIVKRFKCEETGATAIEYGLMAGLISVGIITGAGAIGGSIEQTFTELGELLPKDRQILQVLALNLVEVRDTIKNQKKVAVPIHRNSFFDSDCYC